MLLTAFGYIGQDNSVYSGLSLTIRETPELGKSRVMLLVNTLRYLKFAQIVYFVLHLMKRRCHRSNLVSKQTKSSGIHRVTVTTPVIFLPYCKFRSNDIAEKHFIFLNESQTFNEAVDWSAPGKSRLWRYNLHYFDYLRPDNGLGGETAVGLMKDWIEAKSAGNARCVGPVSSLIEEE